MHSTTRRLLAGTALAAIAQPLAAQTVIDTARTAPVQTSLAAGGQPSDVRIDEDGSITVAAGAAVTVDSDNDIVNEGEIEITNASDASGILVTGARTADITNSAAITIDETYAPGDADNDGDLDGPFALGSNRAAIRVTGPLTGTIRHTGTIVVEGNQSAGIIASAPITGGFVHDGKTSVRGNQSIGVRLGDVSGDVRLAGEITVQGDGAQGGVFAGDLGGTLVVQGAITTSGYRTVPAPADPSKLDADDLLQGGSALVIESGIAKGIVFAAAPKDNVADDKDEDKDGIEDAKEGTAKLVSYGAAPAVQLGGEQDIAIGATVGTASKAGIVLEGSILGDGVYPGISGTGMRIGGRGGAVSIESGMVVTGSIGAAARNAAATGLDLAAGAGLPLLQNNGTIEVKVAGASGTATAVHIRSGASLPVLRNGKAIKATTVKDGSAFAIRDESGTLGLIENSGSIAASGAEAGSARNIAIDLSANTAGAIIRQTAVASGAAAPSISGDIRLGSGADLVDLADGTTTGKVTFGGGIDRMNLSGDAAFTGSAVFGGEADRLELAGSSRFAGLADFGGGAGALQLAGSSVFSGSLAGAQNLTVSVSGGTLDLTGPASIASLDVGASGVIAATVGGGAGATTAITVGGAASFAKGAKIRIRLADITDAEGTFAVLTAGSLSGAGDLAADAALVPFMYKATLATSNTTISVDIDRKATSELGLNAAEAAAFDALYVALAEDEDVANLFLSINDGALFQAFVAQTLPDHAGGGFEGLSQGLRAFDRNFLSPDSPLEEAGKLRVITDFAAWNTQKDREDSAAFDLTGLGFRAGLEYLTGIGAFGITGSWIWNEHTAPADSSIMSDSYEAGVHWRGRFGPLIGFARGGIGRSDSSGTRRFAGGTGDAAVDYAITREWSGDFVSATGGLAVEGGGQFLYFRPSIIVDYLRLSEDGYVEEGGGDALGLTVEDRTSEELAINAGLAVGADLFGMRARDEGWLRIEGEGGWRELVTSDLGETVARFGEGDPFTLTPDARDSGWFARLRGLGGDGSYRIVGEAGLEEQFGNIGYSLRASLRFSW
ncbi:MAG: autotransporter outer membrane beta-barrel domain-containing protein [Erythrobacter sp.]|jgi:hypothetical protein|nr:autotransporter outer membrane beta-barrel domain-containing protein [Erythrobacter sp.]